MKFKNKTQEHLFRSTIAFILILLTLLSKDDKPLLGYVFGSGMLLTISKIVILILACWLAFGKLKTLANSRGK